MQARREAGEERRRKEDREFQLLLLSKQQEGLQLGSPKRGASGQGASVDSTTLEKARARIRTIKDAKKRGS
jgi:hypothetical protein